jgi:hypothetical protein
VATEVKFNSFDLAVFRRPADSGKTATSLNFESGCSLVSVAQFLDLRHGGSVMP